MLFRSDPAALARAIGSLLSDPARAAALGHAGRRRVEQLFQIGRMVGETEALYDGMLLRAGRSELAAGHAR